MRTKENEINIVGTGFKKAFSLRMADGEVRRFGSCDYHDSEAYNVVSVSGKFWIVHYDSWTNHFEEIGRIEIPPSTMTSNGYHDDEHGEWKSLEEIVRLMKET